MLARADCGRLSPFPTDSRRKRIVQIVEQGPPPRAWVMTQNARGEWVPAIPLPYLGLRRRCGACDRRFWTMDGYRGHYALEHILDPEAP